MLSFLFILSLVCYSFSILIKRVFLKILKVHCLKWIVYYSYHAYYIHFHNKDNLLTICLSLLLSVWLSVRLSVLCLYIILSIWLTFFCLSVCLSVYISAYLSFRPFLFSYPRVTKDYLLLNLSKPFLYLIINYVFNDLFTMFILKKALL